MVLSLSVEQVPDRLGGGAVKRLVAESGPADLSHRDNEEQSDGLEVLPSKG